MRKLIGAMLLLGAAASAQATTIYTGTIIGDSGFHSSYPSINASNQSGLSVGYTSGVTDYDAWVALNPTHLGSSYTTGGALDLNTPAFIAYDFGTELTFTDFGLFNDNDYQGIENFDILISNSIDFVGATTLGTFSATFGPGTYSNPVQLQEFDLGGTTGRYVRVDIYGPHIGSTVNFGEFIFGATDASGVPAPASLAILGLGLLGLGLRRKR